MSTIDTAAQRLRTVLRVMIRSANSVSGGNGPTRSEQGVLARLDEQGEHTPATLAAAERVRPQTMGQTLDSLDRHRWIKRTPHPGDRRQVLVSLSPAGRKALEKGRAARQAWLVAELKKLNAKDLSAVIAALDVFEQMIKN